MNQAIIALMKINAKELKEKLAAGMRTDRKKISLYISDKVYRDFQKHCEQIPASIVIEELMAEFNKSASNRKK